MNKENSFSLLLKIVIVIVLLVLIFTVSIIYLKKLNEPQLAKKENIEQIQNKKVVIKKVVINYDKLVEEYKESLIGVMDEFNGNYQYLQEQIVEITVPAGFQELHLQLVLALNPVLYEDNPGITKNKLQKIANDNNWLAKSLNKVILNLI